ncbi:hypothetical protein [Pedosphaera parvula]|uniref:RedB protein n=1 Tax=Pedosphaera parvula (strain Ellin514) TaxID=320771 RepID=B9XPI6_PEDPL|nr:hypothetical protein [Pedosphaera parvula]EEF58214.1 conserved hypothetical protein [Pedosphaera parvula Ellin514]
MGARVFPIRIAFGVLWLLAVGAGFVVMLNYQNASGRVGTTPNHWPAGTRLTLDRTHNTLIMFAHPQCPCTRASLEELNRLLARSRGSVSAQVVFFKPGKFTDDWTRAGLWRSAAAIPGVTVHEDLDGAQAHLFGAETSGYVLLYDTHGQLLFRGGITGARGHAGDNAGENAVVSLSAGQNVTLKQTPVYGCSLLGGCETLPQGTAR